MHTLLVICSSQPSLLRISVMKRLTAMTVGLVVYMYRLLSSSLVRESSIMVKSRGAIGTISLVLQHGSPKKQPNPPDI